VAERAVGYVTLGALVSILAFRIFQPYAFSGPGFFGLKPNPTWVKAIVDQRDQAAGDVDFPPALQWARRPLWFSFQNITVWGLGLPLGLLAWAGFLWVGWRMLKGDWRRHVLLWVWTAAYFIWQSTQFNPTMRYQLPIYPMLAIFAAWAVVALYDHGQASADDPQPKTARWSAAYRPAALVIGGLVLLATFAYAFAFSRIYVRPITRIEASYWIYQNIPGPINLHLETEAGPYNQILPFPYESFVGPGQPFVTTFTAKASGSLSEIYLAHVIDRQSGQAATLTMLVSALPDGEKPLAVLTLQPAPPKDPAEPAGQEYSLQVSPPVEVTQDQVYYLYLSVPDTGSAVNVCGPLVLTIQTTTEIVPQQLAQPAQCVIRAGLPFSLPFTAQQSGLLSEIYLASAADVSARSGPQTIQLMIGPTGDEAVVATATLEADFSLAVDGLSQGYTLLLDQPVTLEDGQSYQLSLSLEEGNGAIQLQGSGLANEGDWDDGLPVRASGYDAFSGIYPTELNFNMYWDDNREKLERFLRIYDQADYIVISSNRQWGVLPRLPERFPMTSLHYRHLLGCPDVRSIEWCYRVAQPGMFQGDLGFELIAVFQSDPKIGPLDINTQFAEEAFTVYDHPKVLVFRKTADYNAEHARAILEAADIDHIVRVTPKKAESYPATLTLPPERLAEQQAGGTWSDFFDPSALHNRVQAVGVLVWYLSVGLLGLLAYPLLRLALPGLPDHGYPLARTAGMLLLAYFTWLAGSFRIPFERLTISIVLALLALLSVTLAYRQRDELRREWSKRWKYFLVVELLALAFFLFFLLIRLGNPDLWHQWKGGEKPMDFSYFNAVLKSTSFPPYDPWYAGGYLNYYYYGYVFVGVLVKWLGLVPAFAYNLILPTLFSLTGMGAFSIAFNLKMAVAQREPEKLLQRMKLADSGRRKWPTAESLPRQRPANRRPPLKTPSLSAAISIGIAAALGMAVLGNLGTLRMVLRGYQQIGIPGGLTDETGLFTRIVGTFQGIAKVVAEDVTLPYSLGDWYWIPSRAIPAPNDVEPITEFPFFTFVYADLHAHMIALPIALLALAWVFSVILGAAKALDGRGAGFLPGRAGDWGAAADQYLGYLRLHYPGRAGGWLHLVALPGGGPKHLLRHAAGAPANLGQAPAVDGGRRWAAGAAGAAALPALRPMVRVGLQQGGFVERYPHPHNRLFCSLGPVPVLDHLVDGLGDAPVAGEHAHLGAEQVPLQPGIAPGRGRAADRLDRGLDVVFQGQCGLDRAAAGSLGRHLIAAPRHAGWQAGGALPGGHRPGADLNGRDHRAARRYRAHEHGLQVLSAGLDAVRHQRSGRAGLAAALYPHLAGGLAHSLAGDFCGSGRLHGALHPAGRVGQGQGPHGQQRPTHAGRHGLHASCRLRGAQCAHRHLRPDVPRAGLRDHPLAAR
jgi:hypothetical protein